MADTFDQDIFLEWIDDKIPHIIQTPEPDDIFKDHNIGWMYRDLIRGPQNRIFNFVSACIQRYKYFQLENLIYNLISAVNVNIEKISSEVLNELVYEYFQLSIEGRLCDWSYLDVYDSIINEGYSIGFNLFYTLKKLSRISETCRRDFDNFCEKYDFANCKFNSSPIDYIEILPEDLDCDRFLKGIKYLDFEIPTYDNRVPCKDGWYSIGEEYKKIIYGDIDLLLKVMYNLIIFDCTKVSKIIRNMSQVFNPTLTISSDSLKEFRIICLEYKTMNRGGLDLFKKITKERWMTHPDCIEVLREVRYVSEPIRILVDKFLGDYGFSITTQTKSAQKLS